MAEPGSVLNPVVTTKARASVTIIPMTALTGFLKGPESFADLGPHRSPALPAEDTACGKSRGSVPENLDLQVRRPAGCG